MRDHGRIEPAEGAHRVIRGLFVDQAVGRANRREAGHAHAAAGQRCLGAEEEQIAGEPLGDVGIAALQDAVLGQQARSHPLGKDVEGQQAMVLGLEEGGGQLPESAHLRVGGAGREAGTDLAHLRGGGQRLVAAEDGQQVVLDLGAGLDVGGAGLALRIARDLAPAPVELPEIGRVDALCPHRLLHRAVLREQSQRRDLLAGQHAAEEIEQAERSMLDIAHQLGCQRLRPADAALHGRFAGTQHGGRRRQADQLESAHALVDLRPRRAQHARIDGADVGAVDRLDILQEAAQRLVGGIERAAQLLEHPGDGADVVGRGRSRLGGRKIETVVHAQTLLVRRS